MRSPAPPPAGGPRRLRAEAFRGGEARRGGTRTFRVACHRHPGQDKSWGARRNPVHVEGRAMTRSLAGASVALLVLGAPVGCGGRQEQGTTVTFPASAVGKEAEVLQRQMARFEEQHPDIRVRMRKTPDAADQKHQLYVQWLNARASDPDILQLDVIWTPE